LASRRSSTTTRFGMLPRPVRIMVLMPGAAYPCQAQ
jgi:hypothetical protein